MDTGKKLNAEQAVELKKAFEGIDTQNEGEVTYDILKMLLKGLGEEFTDEVVDEMIKNVNKDGKTQFQDFIKVATATDGNM